ncbi:putative ABC transport system ATP-binding protein [Tahibacter aquaticus]|uniref:Putative ABC transport system ATP-binding protein n=1 Tax=Tahibacter aquaticus TaxID=520092 RepID=A0A4R6YTQ3_9GAMM|nr:ATP-binding cassette domain-containing protein [Tahibacter aquaticus]TDR41684.1 putative ABC transport system ATP-binding protein [Tahibacter aquaticus]
MPQSADVILSASDVSKAVAGPDGHLQILDSVSLTVPTGETLAIVGASGSGKTTLLGLLAGLDNPDSGDIVLDGSHLNRLDEEARAALRRRRIGFVFQSFHLLPALTAEENVMLPLELEDSGGDARSAAQQALASVGLEKRLHHYPHQLSGGEQQRVAIARAFVHSPRLLFADEPTGNLDARTGRAVSDLLFDLNQARGTTLILVTHDLNLAQRCRHVVRLDGGRRVDEAA